MKILDGPEKEAIRRENPASSFFSTPGIEMDYALFGKGEFLDRAGEMPEYLAFILHGRVRFMAFREDGSIFVMPDEKEAVIGDIQFMTGKPSQFYAEAVTDVVAGIVSLKRYGTPLKTDLMFLQGTLSILSERIEKMLLPGISHLSAEERLMDYIRNILGGRLKNTSAAASALHLSRRHVHRLLSLLVSEGKLIHHAYGDYRVP